MNPKDDHLKEVHIIVKCLKTKGKDKNLENSNQERNDISPVTKKKKTIKMIVDFSPEIMEA